MSDSYRLIVPVTIAKTIPGNERIPDRVENREVTELALEPVTGRAYFDLGPATFTALSPGGGSYEVELDSVIDQYTTRRIKDPDAALIFDALKLADSMALREDLLDLIDVAEKEATAARVGAAPDVVKLIRPVSLHGETTNELRLDEPTYRMFARYGRPYTWSRASDGAVLPMERLSVIRQYIDKCLVHDLGGDLISLLCLADAVQLKRVVLGFFTRAVGAVNTARSSINSSSKEDTSPSRTAMP